MVRCVAKEKSDAITTLYTNLDGARIAVDLEQELGVPIFYSVALSVFTALPCLYGEVFARSKQMPKSWVTGGAFSGR